MMELLIKWLVLSAAFWGTAQMLPGVRIRSFSSAVIVSAIYGVLSVLIGWLLFWIFSIGTFGLGYILSFVTWWIIGAILLTLTDKLSTRIHLTSFKTALFASALISLITAIAHWLIGMVFGA